MTKALDEDVVPKLVSLLRRIDVVIWMNNKERFRRSKGVKRDKQDR